jgi:membrane-bound lytic murein transglycosylase A
VPAARFAAVFAIVAIALVSCERLPPKLTLKWAGFDQLAGWSDDNTAASVPAFLKSCAAFLTRGDREPLDAKLRGRNFGTVGNWRAPCSAAAKLDGTDTAARKFFEDNFVPLLAGNRGVSDGLFTGYYEILLNGSRTRDGPYQTPIYRRPPNPKAYTRAQIEDGALNDKGLELFWVDDPVGAFFLQIQGSGVVQLADGTSVRLGYDGGNGQPYVAIGRLLVDRGEMALQDATMSNLRGWIETHGEAGTALMRDNPSYVFFKVLPDNTGPYGSEGVVLTAGRSLAVDRKFIPLGLPLWLDASERFADGTTRRLVVAQDTGGAIKGPVRGDVFWGSGDEAAAKAGTMNATGHYHLLVPKNVAVRALAVAGN